MNRLLAGSSLLIILSGCGDVKVTNNLGELAPDLPLSPTLFPAFLNGEKLAPKAIEVNSICGEEAVGQSWLPYSDEDIFRFGKAKEYYVADRIEVTINSKLVLTTTSTSAPELAEEGLSRFELGFMLSRTKDGVDCSEITPVLSATADFHKSPGEIAAVMEYAEGHSPDYAAAGEQIKEEFNADGKIFFVCLVWQAYKSSSACVNFSTKVVLNLWGYKK